MSGTAQTVAEWELPTEAASARLARRLTVEFSELEPHSSMDAQIVVTELVTNAVQHAGLSPSDRIALRLGRRGGELRIEVDDRGAFTADSETFGYSTTDDRRHGLGIVEVIATAWQARHGRVTAWLAVS